MKIYIPTYKRTDNQVTINNIPDKLKSFTYLVIRKEEEKEIKKIYNQVIILPENIQNIGSTRQYIVDSC